MPSFLPKPPSPVLQRADPQARGLVGAWPLFEGAGSTVQDLSGRGNHGTLQNSPPWVGTSVGSGLSLASASTQRVAIPSPFPAGVAVSQFTLAVLASGSSGVVGGIGWTNPDACFEFYTPGPTWYCLVSATTNNNFVFTNASATYKSDTLHSYFFVYDGTQAGNTGRIRLFVDGVAIIAGGSAGTVPATFTPAVGQSFYLGYSTDGYSNGKEAFGALWNRALLPYEIAQLSQDLFRLYRPRSRLWEYAVSAPVVAAIPRIFVDA